MVEEWRPVVNYEGWYEVSNLGRVRRVKPGKCTYPGKIISGMVMTIGYRCVGLSKCETKSKQRYVHHLVAAAFLGLRPEKHQINHKDGDKLNNRLSNLEYVTHKENARHAARSGLLPVGENSHCAVLTDDDIRAIRGLHGTMTNRELGAIYRIDNGHIHRIATRQLWKHVS